MLTGVSGLVLAVGLGVTLSLGLFLLDLAVR
jgi:hypothetical protein